MDLDHLPRQARSQIAGVAVHYANQARHVVRQLRAATVAVVVDEREVVFETDARTNRNYTGQQCRQLSVIGVLAGVVGRQKCAAVQKEAPSQAAPPHNANGVGAMSVLRPRLRQMLAAFFYVPQRILRGNMRRAGLEPARAFLSVPRLGAVERFAIRARSARCVAGTASTS